MHRTYLYVIEEKTATWKNVRQQSNSKRVFQKLKLKYVNVETPVNDELW
jgi:hypothetical protein